MNTYQTFKSGPKKGQPKTLTDRVVRYLVEGRGMTEMTSRSKFRWFVHPGSDSNYFVGGAGAVRSGKTSSNSVSLTDMVHRMMKVWEKKVIYDNKLADIIYGDSKPA